MNIIISLYMFFSKLLVDTIKKGNRFFYSKKVKFFDLHHFWVGLTDFIAPTCIVCFTLGMWVFSLSPSVGAIPLKAINEFIGLTGIKISLYSLIILSGLNISLLRNKVLRWLLIRLTIICFNLSSIASGVFLGLMAPAILMEYTDGFIPIMNAFFILYLTSISTILIFWTANPYYRRCVFSWLYKTFPSYAKLIRVIVGVMVMAWGGTMFFNDGFCEVKNTCIK